MGFKIFEGKDTCLPYLHFQDPSACEREGRYLRLFMGAHGGVYLAVVNEDGEPVAGGYLLVVDNDTMRVKRCDKVERELGFDLDEKGRIKFEN